MLGHHRPASETPLKWRFASGPMMARFNWYLDPLSPHQIKKKERKEEKNVVRIEPPVTRTELSGSAHVPNIKHVQMSCTCFIRCTF